MELLLQRTKSDHEGAGRTVFIRLREGSRCPVKALKNWLEITEIADGHFHDKVVRNKALTPQSVAFS